MSKHEIHLVVRDRTEGFTSLDIEKYEIYAAFSSKEVATKFVDTHTDGLFLDIVSLAVDRWAEFVRNDQLPFEVTVTSKGSLLELERIDYADMKPNRYWVKSDADAYKFQVLSMDEAGALLKSSQILESLRDRGQIK